MSSKPTSVTLGQHFQAFVEEQIRAGRFASASEVVRAGLRLLEDHESELKSLRAALADGEASGPAAALDHADFRAQMRGEYLRRDG